MKKLLAFLLVLVMSLACFSCVQPTPPDNGDEVTVMTHAEYVAAPLDSAVVIEAYVQATQSWWDNKITVYLQEENGAYLAYEMTCTEEQSKTLVKGQKIRVTGHKAEWSGEVEITDCTFEVLEGNWVATPADLTAKLGTDDLINHQNELAIFKGMTVKSISYKGGEPGDDIYLTVTKDGADYDFCVERYLTAPDTEVYQLVATLAEGDVLDITGFVYWYNGPNPHITSITVVGE